MMMMMMMILREEGNGVDLFDSYRLLYFVQDFAVMNRLCASRFNMIYIYYPSILTAANHCSSV